MAAEPAIAVNVIFSPAPREVHEVVLQLASGCTVLQAVQASGLLQMYPSISLEHAIVGVWGRKVSLKQTLRENDRVEVYRPLRVDPKVARRERFARQGARTAGLFIKKRAGAKAGY
jgi:putative ubiquitin-RnfH superfamily antitoxin RatB of RatAB toxin-antitoxin module